MNIDICICTYKRESLYDTLLSIYNTRVPKGVSYTVIVADNDQTPSNRYLVEQFNQDYTASVKYIHAPSSNICIARNACLDYSESKFLIFIDDDEIVTKNWLVELTKQKDSYAAILGPVKAIYADDAPKWLKSADLHSIKPTMKNNKVISGYTSNVLISKDKFNLHNYRFDEVYGQSGGEDTIFFNEAINNGTKIGFAPEAYVTEIVPKERERLSWLIRRKFRSGQTHAVLLKKQLDFNISVEFIKALNKLLFCHFMAILTLFNKSKSISWLLRGSLHGGVIAGLLSEKKLTIYGN